MPLKDRYLGWLYQNCRGSAQDYGKARKCPLRPVALLYRI